MLKALAATLSLLALALVGFVAYSAPAPYTLPTTRFVEPLSDFEPTAATRPGDARRVIVLVFDGLSPAAVRAAETPNLDRMAREGASTLDMLPEFPTLSLPNHFTLGTGCRPGPVSGDAQSRRSVAASNRCAADSVQPTRCRLPSSRWCRPGTRRRSSVPSRSSTTKVSEPVGSHSSTG